MKRLFNIILALSMALALCLVPKNEVKAVETRASTPIPVDAYDGKTISITDGYVYIEVHMTGTMIRNNTGAVISHDVDFDAYHADGSTYYAANVEISSTSVRASGRGIIATVNVFYDVVKASNGMIIHHAMSTTITVSCGV